MGWSPRKTKGEQTGSKLSIPLMGGYGGKIWPWNQIRTPRKEEKKYLSQFIKLKLKEY